MSNNKKIFNASLSIFFMNRNIGKRTNGGRISTAICKNVAARREPSLFDALPEEQRALFAPKGEPQLIRGNGKPTYLTNYEHKLLNALSFFITQYLNDDDIKEMMESLSIGVAPKQKYINRTISITKLCKFLNGGSARAREKLAVISGLQRLANTYQLQIFGGSSTDRTKRSFRMTKPLIILGDRLNEDEITEGTVDAQEVLFGPIFFYDVATKFAILTPNLFDIWGKKGNGTETELFPILLADLGEKYRQYYIAAQNIRRKIETDSKNDNISRDELQEKINKAQEKSLTYNVLFVTLKEKVATDYSSTKQYKHKFKKDLTNCIHSLLEYGIIEKASIEDEQEKIQFLFSLNFANNNEFGIEENDTESILIE